MFGITYNYVNEGCEIYEQFLDKHGFETRAQAEQHLKENEDEFFGPGSQATVIELTPARLETIPGSAGWPGHWLDLRPLSRGEINTYKLATTEDEEGVKVAFASE